MKMTDSNVPSGQGTLLTNEELQVFENMSIEIISTVCELNQSIILEESEDSNAISSFTGKWLKYVMQENVLGGKKLRGLMVAIAVKSFLKHSTTIYLHEQMRLAYALGWILEIIQSVSLIADDVMDNSDTRRGKPCWYRRPDVGLAAVNDSFLLETVAFQVLKIYFKEEGYYRELYRVLQDIIFYTVHGQSLDCHTESCQENILESYTMERYDSIVKFKTSYYTIHMPVICAMIMTGKSSDANLVNQVEEITLQIGHYFQVQDDFLDCFGDLKKTGKVGTDIQDRKCTWLFVTAAGLCKSTVEQEILVGNYGNEDPSSVEKVKGLYGKLGIKEAYKDYEKMTYRDLSKKIHDLPESMPQDLFQELLQKLYKRCI